MGDPGLTASSHKSFPIHFASMRNSRGRLFVYVAVVSVLCFIVFMLSSTHSNLKELEGVNERCQQQRDSLSAQLQVVYEHKNRLEKSLQQEKSDHRHTKETNEKQAADAEMKVQKEKEEKQKMETQLSQIKTSFSELEEEKNQAENVMKQQLKSVQVQKDAEIEKLQNHVSDLISEKDKLDSRITGYIIKFEQHHNDLSLCRLETDQVKKSLEACQAGHHTPDVTNSKVSEKILTADANNNVIDVMPNAIQQPPKHNEIPKVFAPEKIEVRAENRSVPSTADRPHILSRPHVMPAADGNLGDGVLPKPMDARADDVNRDVDAALEVVDNRKADLLGHINNGRYEGKMDDNDEILKRQLGNLQAAENHPQVAPPNIETVDEKDDHGGERGEDGLQYANPEQKQQMEVPNIPKPHELPPAPKPLAPHDNNNDLNMVNDMMNKSPGEVANDNLEHQNVLHRPPAPHLGPIDNKIMDLRNENGPFLHRGADGHGVMDEKNYDDADDDDRENDDEPANGLVPAAKSGNILQDNDFDDQDNVDNAKEVEGVVVAPK